MRLDDLGRSEGWATRGIDPGPVADRRQQESADHRPRVAKQHLVAVPTDALEARFAGQRGVIVQGPPRDQTRAEQTAEELRKLKSLLNSI